MAALVLLTPLPFAFGKTRNTKKPAARAPNAGLRRRAKRNGPERAPRVVQLIQLIAIWKQTTSKPEKRPMNRASRRKRCASLNPICAGHICAGHKIRLAQVGPVQVGARAFCLALTALTSSKRYRALHPARRLSKNRSYLSRAVVLCPAVETGS